MPFRQLRKWALQMQLGVALVELHLISDDGFLFVNLVPPLLAHGSRVLLHDQKAQRRMCL